MFDKNHLNHLLIENAYYDAHNKSRIIYIKICFCKHCNINICYRYYDNSYWYFDTKPKKLKLNCNEEIIKKLLE